MTGQDVAALIGAVGGTIGAIAGFIVYLQSGSRVKVKISLGIAQSGLAVGAGQMGLIVIDPRKFKGTFGYGLDLKYAKLVAIVSTVNSGRLAVNVDSLRLTRKKVELGGGNLFQGAHSLPHRFEFGTSAIWTAPFEDARNLAFATIPKDGIEGKVGAAVKLGNGKSIRSKRDLSPKHIRQVLEAWEQSRLDPEI